LRHDNDAERKFIEGGQSATAVGLVMQDRVDDPPVVRCPGCNQPMEAKERTPVKEGLVDIRYVCAGCGMETKRPIADEAH
jgi:DNA-directed RNA polymerase subunit RPC12/RpoP